MSRRRAPCATLDPRRLECSSPQLRADACVLTLTSTKLSSHSSISAIVAGECIAGLRCVGQWSLRSLGCGVVECFIEWRLEWSGRRGGGTRCSLARRLSSQVSSAVRAH